LAEKGDSSARDDSVTLRFPLPMRSSSSSLAASESTNGFVKLSTNSIQFNMGLGVLDEGQLTSDRVKLLGNFVRHRGHAGPGSQSTHSKYAL
jgi:hypothetical protein